MNLFCVEMQSVLSILLDVVNERQKALGTIGQIHKLYNKILASDLKFVRI